MLSTPSILLYAHPIKNTDIYLQSLVETIVLRENIIIARQMDQLIKQYLEKKFFQTTS